MIVYDFEAWPKDANELTARLYGWWSRSEWLLAPAQRFELRSAAPKAAVLPLNDTGIDKG